MDTDGIAKARNQEGVAISRRRGLTMGPQLAILRRRWQLEGNRPVYYEDTYATCAGTAGRPMWNKLPKPTSKGQACVAGHLDGGGRNGRRAHSMAIECWREIAKRLSMLSEDAVLLAFWP